jgi:hypothetical protein
MLLESGLKYSAPSDEATKGGGGFGPTNAGAAAGKGGGGRLQEQNK